MDPQNTSIITSIVLYGLGSLATLLVTKGILSQDQASTLVPEICTAIVGIVSAALIYWKKRQLSQTAMIKAINTANNGVTVVPTTPINTAQQVDAPMKGPEAIRPTPLK